METIFALLVVKLNLAEYSTILSRNAPARMPNNHELLSEQRT